MLAVPLRGSYGSNCHLVRELVTKEFLVRYNASFFGIVWTQVYPLMLLAVYTVVFTQIFPSTVSHFPLFVFVGISLWHFFGSAIQLATNSILANSYLITRISFDRALVPVAAVLVAFVDLAMSHVVILVATLLYGVTPTWSWLALPFLVVGLALLCIGVGLALSAIAVHFRDIRWFVDVGMLMLMFLTPIFYGPATVPPHLEWLLTVNPLAVFLSAYRSALIEATPPDASTWVHIAAFASTSMALGMVAFRRMERGLADVL